MLSRSYYVLNGNDMVVYVGSKGRCWRVQRALRVAGDNLARLYFGPGMIVGTIIHL